MQLIDMTNKYNRPPEQGADREHFGVLFEGYCFIVDARSMLTGKTLRGSSVSTRGQSFKEPFKETRRGTKGLG